MPLLFSATYARGNPLIASLTALVNPYALSTLGIRTGAYNARNRNLVGAVCHSECWGSGAARSRMHRSQ